MIRLLILVCGMHLIYLSTSAQLHLSGRVLGDNNLPLSEASVFIYPGSRGTKTDKEGNFAIKGLQKGIYRIEISFMGYLTLTDSINLINDIFYDAILKPAPLNLEEVVVVENYNDFRKKQENLNIEIIDKDYLIQHQGGSLMMTLEELPGISSIDIGSGQSKPLIRGLGFNRVVIVENGIKHEAQQWGAEHGLEIDQFAIEEIEIIKGPSSLIYGSDAIAGVIDIIQFSIPEENTFEANIDLTGRTNNNLLGGSLRLSARKKRIYINAQATLLDNGDYTVPASYINIYSYQAPLHKKHLRNTASKEYNFQINSGFIAKNFQSAIFISNYNNKSGFFANAHGLEPRMVDTIKHDHADRDILYPFHQVHHFKAINRNLWFLKKLRLAADLGFQRNVRSELSNYISHGYMPAVFPDTLGFGQDLELYFDKYTYSINLRTDYEYNERLLFTTGASGSYQNNKTGGYAFIMPSYRQWDAGIYFISRFNITKQSSLQAGIRYDYGNIETMAYDDWFPSAEINGYDTVWKHVRRSDSFKRSFSNISWSLGYSIFNKKYLFKVNIGKSYRMPIAIELGANGVNYHRFSYEKGNPDLLPEVSYQLDAGFEFSAKILSFEIHPFVNYFSNYIYLNPTPEYDRFYGNGNQIYCYSQSDVFRYGGEVLLNYIIYRSIHLGLIGEYVYSVQLNGEKKGYTLPFSPPVSGIIYIKYLKKELKSLKNLYVSFDFEIAAAQNNIVPPEEKTGAYQLFNLGFGCDFFPKGQRIGINFSVQNILNKKYFRHTSYYRIINVPEPGINFLINLSFQILKQKNKTINTN